MNRTNHLILTALLFSTSVILTNPALAQDQQETASRDQISQEQGVQDATASPEAPRNWNIGVQ